MEGRRLRERGASLGRSGDERRGGWFFVWRFLDDEERGIYTRGNLCLHQTFCLARNWKKKRKAAGGWVCFIGSFRVIRIAAAEIYEVNERKKEARIGYHEFMYLSIYADERAKSGRGVYRIMTSFFLHWMGLFFLVVMNVNTSRWELSPMLQGLEMCLILLISPWLQGVFILLNLLTRLMHEPIVPTSRQLSKSQYPSATRTGGSTIPITYINRVYLFVHSSATSSSLSLAISNHYHSYYKLFYNSSYTQPMQNPW